METIIRLMANSRTYDEQTHLVERMTEFSEFAGLTLACMVVLSVMAIV